MSTLFTVAASTPSAHSPRRFWAFRRFVFPDEFARNPDNADDAKSKPLAIEKVLTRQRNIVARKSKGRRSEG